MDPVPSFLDSPLSAAFYFGKFNFLKINLETITALIWILCGSVGEDLRGLWELGGAHY